MVPLVGNRIKTIKERCRGIINVLPYALSVPFIIWLVTFVVSSLNFVPTKGAVVASRGGATTTAIPHVLFTGRPVAYKDTALTFGQYVELPTYPTQYNSSYINPRGTLQGSWVFSLQTNKLVSRSRWIPLPMPELVIRKMNSIANRKRRLDGDLVFHLGGEEVQAPHARLSSTGDADAEELRAVDDELNREAAIAELEELQNDNSELLQNLPQTQVDAPSGNTASGDMSGPLGDEGKLFERTTPRSCCRTELVKIPEGVMVTHFSEMTPVLLNMSLLTQLRMSRTGKSRLISRRYDRQPDTV